MTQWVKSLLFYGEALRFDPKHPCKTPGVAECIHPNAGGQRQAGPGV